MKRREKGFIRFSLVGLLAFSLTIATFSSFAILVYDKVNKVTGGDRILIGLAVASTIIFGAVVCCVVDIIRRKKMIETPLMIVLDATKKIAEGDFSVKIETLHDYSKYDGFDLIAENINVLTAELSKNEVLKNDFISNVSHEIKTPLAVIQNYTKTLQKGNLSKEKEKEIFDKLVLQSEKLSQLVSNILRLNKLENQELPKIEEVDLAEHLRVSTLSFEDIIESKGLELVCDIDEMKLSTSASLLELVFNNLISNAIKFTDKGKITVSLKAEDKNAIIKIQDEGCGISQEVGERIFEKFFQGDTSHSGEGNGLGLALVKKVIDVLGGEIFVESKVGKGSTFTIKIRKG